MYPYTSPPRYHDRPTPPARRSHTLHSRLEQQQDTRRRRYKQLSTKDGRSTTGSLPSLPVRQDLGEPGYPPSRMERLNDHPYLLERLKKSPCKLQSDHSPQYSRKGFRQTISRTTPDRGQNYPSSHAERVHRSTKNYRPDLQCKKTPRGSNITQ